MTATSAVNRPATDRLSVCAAEMAAVTSAGTAAYAELANVAKETIANLFIKNFLKTHI